MSQATGGRRSDRMLDTRPLRSSVPFRRLWVGTAAVSFSGQVALVAVLFQVWQLTHSPAWVGAIGLVTAVPTIGCGLWGGVLADTVDRRRLVLTSSLGDGAAAIGLVAQAVLHVHSLPTVLALVGLQTACGAVGGPSRRTFVRELLPAPLVPAGVALNHMSFQLAMLTGPAVAGLLLGAAGTGAAYGLDVAATCVALYGVGRLPVLRSASALAPPPRMLRDSLRLANASHVLRGCLTSDLAATVLAMPVALFPELNQQRFSGRPETLGLFLSAMAVGGVIASLTSGAWSRIARAGAVMLVGAGTWGVALALLGVVRGLVPTLLCLAVAGAADTASVVSRGTIVQLATPADYLGRLTALEGVVGSGGPGLGNARAGAVASLSSAGTATFTGGIACALAIGCVALGNSGLRRWRGPAAAGAT